MIYDVKILRSKSRYYIAICQPSPEGLAGGIARRSGVSSSTCSLKGYAML